MKKILLTIAVLSTVLAGCDVKGIITGKMQGYEQKKEASYFKKTDQQLKEISKQIIRYYHAEEEYAAFTVKSITEKEYTKKQRVALKKEIDELKNIEPSKKAELKKNQKRLIETLENIHAVIESNKDRKTKDKEIEEYNLELQHTIYEYKGLKQTEENKTK